MSQDFEKIDQADKKAKKAKKAKADHAYYLKNKEAIKARVKAYTEQQDREKLLAYKAAHREANKERYAEIKKQWYERNKDEVRRKAKQRNEENKELIAERRKLYREANKEVIKLKKQAYYYANKKQINLRHKNYRTTNKDKIIAYRQSEHGRAIQNSIDVKRRKAKIQRVPSWLTEADFEKIKRKYAYAQRKTETTGEQWDVDHIIPLQGKFVSGLHVPANLRVIKHTTNCSKRNHFDLEKEWRVTA